MTIRYWVVVVLLMYGFLHPAESAPDRPEMRADGCTRPTVTVST